ncbi:MAG: L-seryl-tRNA(Sec) selenium transferase, partial [Gaiellaceae bacterium]
MSTNPLRELPSVDELLGRDELAALAESHGRPLVLAAARSALERAREDVRAGFPAGDLVARTVSELETRLAPRLRRVLNATGVVVHTNLGRAPLAESALARVQEVGAGYSNLEYDVAAGARGSRQDHVAAVLRELTGAEAALVVNNNAAALVLALNTLARGRDAIISRGELVEIGGSFRVPEIMARAGTHMVEVGSTNRTHAEDYAAAIGERTAVILKVHPSNFRVTGFTADVEVPRLAELARAHDVPLLHDLGSGLLIEAAALGLPYEPTAARALREGASLVTMSGDKLLGGPQAGIVVGSASLIEQLRRNPLCRALRVDKLTLAALEATLA